MKENRNKSKNKKKPWPTQRAMRQVYEKKLWGTNQDKFYSGEGSHNQELVQPYLDAVSTFLTSFTQPLAVCDLGCGDFNVGKQLVALTQKYMGIDIVPELIAHNQKTFVAQHLEFACLDIAKDPLPLGECVLLRHVLQHLSNAEIAAILPKLKQYTYIILTEHLPDGTFKPNKDIISGQGIRIKKQSGVAVQEAPFHFNSNNQKELVSIRLNGGQGIIKTVLYTMA